MLSVYVAAAKRYAAGSMVAQNPLDPPTIPEPEQFAPRSRFSPVLGVIVGLVAGIAIAGGVAMFLPGARQPSVAASASEAPASAAPSASAPAPTELTLVARAERGEAKAVSEIESRALAERSAEETLALAEARAQKKRAQIQELGRKLELVPKLGRDKETIARIKEFVYDREIGNHALAMLARVPHDVGPDLLYVVWTGTPRKSDSTELAEQLLYSKDVRERASPALSVALDLRVEDDCEKMKNALERAIAHGDRRSLVPIMRLNNKRGCGAKKLDDCWACLRDGDLVKNALKESGKRP